MLSCTAQRADAKNVAKASKLEEKMLSHELDIEHNAFDIAALGLLTKHSTFKQKELVKLLESAKRQFLREPIIAEKSGDVLVVGDIYGQLEDLVRIFRQNGTPATQLYVDRGPFGVECFMLLAAYKLLYPHNILLLRGNHENEEQNHKRNCGFEAECTSSYCFILYQSIACTCFLTL